MCTVILMDLHYFLPQKIECMLLPYSLLHTLFCSEVAEPLHSYLFLLLLSLIKIKKKSLKYPRTFHSNRHVTVLSHVIQHRLPHSRTALTQETFCSCIAVSLHKLQQNTITHQCDTVRFLRQFILPRIVSSMLMSWPFSVPAYRSILLPKQALVASLVIDTCLSQYGTEEARYAITSML